MRVKQTSGQNTYRSEDWNVVLKVLKVKKQKAKKKSQQKSISSENIFQVSLHNTILFLDKQKSK